MIRLKQSTASQEVPLGPFVDATDGFTAETGLTIANTDIKLWKSGAAAAVNKNSGGATHDAGNPGNYIATLDATDTDTLGPLVITVASISSTNRPVRVECEVLPAVVYDSLQVNTGLASDLKAIIADVVSASKLGAVANTAATTVVSDQAANSTTSVHIALFLTTPAEIATVVNQMRGKVLRFTTNASNSDGITGAEARISASTVSIGTPPLNYATLTVEPPLPDAPVPGDIAVIIDGELAEITASRRVKASVEELQGSTQAAQHLTRMGLASASGTLAAGSTTTVLNISSITPTLIDANQLRSRVVLIVDESGSEAALKIQGGRISASTTTTITLEQPLTRAPAPGNVFIVL